MLQSYISFFQDTVVEMINQPWFFGLLVALVVLMVFLILSLRCHSRDVKVISDKNGQTLVSRRALRDLVHLACERTGTPGHPKITFNPRRGRLNLRVRVKLYEGQRLVELRDKLRQSLIQTFEQAHGILIGDVDVVIDGFKKGAHGHGSYQPEEEEEETETQYISIKPMAPPLSDASKASADQDDDADDEKERGGHR